MKNDRKIYPGKQITFEFECHENWQKMNPTERGRMCQLCKKDIYDFRQWETKDVHNLLIEEKKKNNSVCGILRQDQVQRYFTVYARRKGEPHPQLKFLAALLIVFGFTLFACENDYGNELAQSAMAKKSSVVHSSSQTVRFNRVKPLTEEIDLVKRCRPAVSEHLSDDPPGKVMITAGIPVIEDPPVVGDIGPTTSDPTFYTEDPEFPGGEGYLFEYLSRHVRYPMEAVERNLEGRVYVQFIVNKDGKIQDKKVVKGVDPILDKEALRVVGNMPDWNPGKNAGKTVDVSYTLPISFVLK